MYRKSKIVMMCLFLGLCLTSYGQEYKLVKGESFLKVLGTSTMHDWHEDVKEFSGYLTLEKLEILKVTSLELKVLAESLESVKSLMNKLTYEALKTEKHPNILFTLVGQEKISKVKDGEYDVLLKGYLTAAGVKKKISIKLKLIQNESQIILEGSKKIKMTEYGMKPPTAMFGTIKTGDEVTIEFKTIYKL